MRKDVPAYTDDIGEGGEGWSVGYHVADEDPEGQEVVYTSQAVDGVLTVLVAVARYVSVTQQTCTVTVCSSFSCFNLTHAMF